MECFTSVNVPQIIVPDAQESNSSSLVNFGACNDYPNKIQELIDAVPLLSSLIQSSALSLASSSSDHSDFFNQLFTSLLSINSCYILYQPALPFPFRVLNYVNCRVSAEMSKVFYSNSKYFNSRKEFPVYNSLFPDRESVIILSLNRRVQSHYSLPLFHSALKSIVVLSQISDYNSSALANNFNPSAIINFCNGIPSDEERKQIEERLNDKFSGSSNVRKLLVSFSNDKDHSPQVTSFKSETISDEFTNLLKTCKEDLFTVFRCTPSLVGIPDGASTALSDTEYQAQAQLFWIFTLKPYAVLVQSVFQKFGLEYEVRNPFKTIFDLD